MNTPRRILLTGGAGFVGTRLAPRLAGAFPNAERVLLVRCDDGDNQATPGWRTEVGDVVDRETMAELVASLRPDLIVHLAAQASVGSSASHAAVTWEVNFGGVYALARACARAKLPTTLLFASSGEVYGRSFLAGPVDEDAPLQPVNAYARSKAAAEGALHDLMPQEARIIVARAFNHTGAGQDARFVIPSFAKQIAAIEQGLQAPTIQVGNLDAARDFLDVGDVCDAYLRLIAQADVLPHRATFNIASGRAYRVGDLLARLQRLASCDFAVEIDPLRLRPIDIPRAVGVNDRLRAAIGWMPTTPIARTLEDVLNGARWTLRASNAV